MGIRSRRIIMMNGRACASFTGLIPRRWITIAAIQWQFLTTESDCHIENAELKSFSFTRVATVKKEAAERPILLFSLRQCFLWYWWMQLNRNATTSPSMFRLHRQKSARQGWVLKRRSCKLSLYRTRQTPRTLPKKPVLYKPSLFLAGFLFRFYTK